MALQIQLSDTCVVPFRPGREMNIRRRVWHNRHRSKTGLLIYKRSELKEYKAPFFITETNYLYFYTKGDNFAHNRKWIGLFFFSLNLTLRINQRSSKIWASLYYKSSKCYSYSKKCIFLLKTSCIILWLFAWRLLLPGSNIWGVF